MKKLLILTILVFTFSLSFAQGGNKEKAEQVLIVEASCGQCNFGMADKGCDLAIRVEGKSYFVDGTTIDSHGDAHAADGFCQVIRKAEVQGKFVNDRFKALSFKLLPISEDD